MILSTSSPRLSLRLSLAPTQINSNNAGITQNEGEEGASMLMDMSLTELKKSSPVKGKRLQVTESDLDRLSQEELEQLAWEAMEEEKRLEGTRRSKRLSSGTTDATMKNATKRRKSNTPNKSKKVEKSPEALLAPLPRILSSSTTKHAYDPQASPSRSALKRPNIRKSVAFGEVAEFELSIEKIESSSDQIQVEESQDNASSSTFPSTATEEKSSSPLSRFTKSVAPLSTPRSLFKTAKGFNVVPRSSPRIKEAKFKSERPELSRKTTSKKSPTLFIAKTRLREAIQESSVKARIKARESAVIAKTKAKDQIKAPSGFRMSSTGTLVAQTQCQPFSVASQRRASSSAPKSVETDGGTVPIKANPIPEWMKRRKEALKKEEDGRLQKELERVRAQELGGQEETTKNEKKRRRPTEAQTTHTSAVEKRIVERAQWEAKRKAKEELIASEKSKARQEREEREEEEYRLARQKTVIRANPVPNFVRARAAR